MEKLPPSILEAGKFQDFYLLGWKTKRASAVLQVGAENLSFGRVTGLNFTPNT